MEEWNFENWGIKYWSKTPEFLQYVEEHLTPNPNLSSRYNCTLQPELLDELVDLYGDRHAIISESYYIRGFKFGLRLAVECFDFSDIDEKE